MSEFVKPKTCRRCAGTGYVSSRVVHGGAPGGCFSCDGRGEVESDRATIAAAKAFVAGSMAFREAAIAASWEADMGSRHLEEHEPARYATAVAAFAAGDARVLPALVAYWAEVSANA